MRRGAGPVLWAVATALAAAAVLARAAEPAADAERELAVLEARLAAVETRASAAQEDPAARGRLGLARGEARFQAGDHAGALAPLHGALERADLPGAERLRARWLVGESLVRLGRCPAALEALSEVAASDAPEARQASTRWLACLERLGRDREVPRALERVKALHGGSAPPESLYLAAKSAQRRLDLPAARRDAEALAALEAVPAPFALAATYLRGALHVRAGALDRALAEFERCGGGEPQGERERQVRDLCLLALGRVHGAARRPEEALAAYGRVPRGAARLDEALHESAWVNLRARRLEPALRSAGLVAEAAPDSPLAPRATLLQGHLLLRLDRPAEAVEAYSRVVNGWAPLRDDLDVLLAAGGGSGPPDESAVPPVALRWAADDPRWARARELLAGLEEARRDLAASSAAADRLEAAVERAWGLGAAPDMEEAFGVAESVENAAVALAGRVADEEARLLGPGFMAGEAWLRSGDARQDAGAALARLPSTPQDLAARAGLRRERAVAFDAFAARLDLEARGCAAVATSAQRWLARHAAAAGGSPQDRREVDAELRVHAGIAGEYRREVAGLRVELVRAGDAAGRGEDAPAADQLREAFRAALAEQEELLARARAGLPEPARPRARAIDGLRVRLVELGARADRAKRRALAAARTRAEAARAELAQVRVRLEEDAAALGRIEAEARQAAGGLALGALRSVRDRLQQVVREADAGIADAAWARKRAAAERIQALSAGKAKALERVEAEFGGLARELE